MKIQHKRSAVAIGGKAKEPTAAQTEQGELCVNFSSEDPALFIKDADENIIRVGGDLSLYQKLEDVPSATIVCSPSEIDTLSPPDTRGEGSLWWNTEDGILYVWYEDDGQPGVDGDGSSQWVIAVPQGGGAGGDVPPGTTVGDAPPSNPEVGQLWWNSDDTENGGGRLYVYYYDGNSYQWVDTSVPGGGGFSGDYNDLENKPNIPEGFDLEDGSEVNNLIVWRSQGEVTGIEASLGAADQINTDGGINYYADMPTDAIPGGGSGLRINYVAYSDTEVKLVTVAFPGSGYSTGDIVTVTDRGFTVQILNTSDTPGDHPGPDSEPGWYPERGANYYLSTRSNSIINSQPTFNAGYVVGGYQDNDSGNYKTPQPGVTSFYPIGGRTVNIFDFYSDKQTQFKFKNSDWAQEDVNSLAYMFYEKGSDTNREADIYLGKELIFTKYNPSTGDAIYKGGLKSGVGFQLRNLAHRPEQTSFDFGVSITQASSGAFYVTADNYAYTFNLKDYSSNLELKGTDGKVGLYTEASTQNGEYGIFHNSVKTVSVANQLGELRIGTNGNFNFIKESKTIAIIPNSTSKNISNNGIIEAAAAAVPYGSFDSTNNRRIACFGVNNTPGSEGYTKITHPSANGPQIKGNGIIQLNANLNANGNSITGATFFMATEADDPAAYQTTYSLDEDGQQVEEQEYIGATENLLEVIADLRARLAALEGA